MSQSHQSKVSTSRRRLIKAALAGIVAPAVLRHRLQLRPEAELERYTADDAVATAIAAIPVPR